MPLDDFQYHKPGTLAEACDLLTDLGDKAAVLAGGTDLLADLKRGFLRRKHLVSLAGVAELHVLEADGDGLSIGCLVTPNRLAASPLVHERLTALADAGASMAGVQIRNLATLGGNLASAVPSGDLQPPLMTVDAGLRLVRRGRERRLGTSEFFLGPRKTALEPGEILASIHVPAAPPGSGTAYEKFQLRAASALAVVGAAAAVTIAAGKVENACVSVGAAAPTPILIPEAGDCLCGSAPTHEALLAAGEIAAREVKPISDHRGSATYRRDLARTLTVRALRRAIERATTREVLPC